MENNRHFEKTQLPYIFLILLAAAYAAYRGYTKEALIFILLTSATFLFFNSFHIFRRRKWDRFVEDSVNNLSSSWVNMVEDMPFPVTAFTKDGNIAWYNKAFRTLFPEDEKMVEIDDLLNTDTQKMWKGEIPSVMEIDGKVFSVTPLVYKAAADEFQEDLLILHFLDISAVREAENSKVVTLLVEVDNFSEVLNSAPEDRRPLITADIERELLNYANSIKGFMKKYGTSKVVITAPYEVVREEIRNKFPILDSIKKIDHENTIEPTLSIGAAYDNGNSLEDGEAATRAKELALGRGGDQAVVKVREKLSFFGGNTREMEKKSKVRSRVIARALRDLMMEADRIYIMGHSNPDMDCLGAAVGIHSIAQSLGKDSVILMDEPRRNVNDLLERLTQDENYRNAFITSQEAQRRMKPDDLLVIVDVHSLGYVLNRDVAVMNVKKVVIDHHRRAQDAIPGAIINYIETYASSTSELVTELIQYVIEKPKLSKIEADALLAGIWVDTKNFYFKTGVRTFEAASFLRKSGANTIDIRSMFSYDKDLFLMKAAIIKSAEITDGTAVAECPPGTDDPLIAAQTADEFLNIKGIHTSFVLSQSGDNVILSARSLGDINVQTITEEFGGGGHSTMAGATIYNTTTLAVKEKLMEILKDRKLEEEEKNESDTSQGRTERR